MRISDWSSDVCSSDLSYSYGTTLLKLHRHDWRRSISIPIAYACQLALAKPLNPDLEVSPRGSRSWISSHLRISPRANVKSPAHSVYTRSEEHTSELQSLMRISYAVFCLQKKKNKTKHQHKQPQAHRQTH